MTLPHSLDAERSLVNRLVVEPDQIGIVASELVPEDFYIEAYRSAYRAMLAITEAGGTVDVVSLGDAGEPVDVLELTAGHHAPLMTYIEVIKQKAYQRRMMLLGQDLITAADDGNTSRIIEVATLAVEEAVSVPHENTLGLIDLADHRNPPSPPLLGVLSPEGTTVLYGDGGDGKGWVAAKWASQLDSRVAIIDFEQHPNEWAYRLDKFGFGADRPLYLSPSSTMAKWADMRAARLLRNEGIGFLVIDSAMYASNIDDPYSPASALEYKRARSRLGNLPAILLAHTTGGQDKIFGSVFWRNEARMVWRLGKDFVSRQRFLECRKANNYSEMEGKKFNIEFDEDRGILNLHPHGQPWSPGSGLHEMVSEEELSW